MGNGASIQELKKLAEALPPLVELVTSRSGKDIEYKVENGKCVGSGLLNKANVAVMQSNLKKGTSFPKHSHDVVEILVVIEGKLQVSSGGIDKIVEVSEVIRLAIGDEHKCVALEDTELIGITIPRSPGYPNA